MMGPDNSPTASRSLKLLLALGLALLALGCAPALAAASAGWQSGPLVESQDNNCITGDVEYEAGSYLSYYTDPANPPKAGDVYYVAIDLTGIGNTCAGIYADINLITPSGTAPAVSATHPVLCYLGLPNASSFTRDTQDCPQNLQLSSHGYSLDPLHANPPFWPIPQGGTVEIQVPVVSTTAGTHTFNGYVQLADGEFDPTLVPTLYTVVDPSNVNTGGGTQNTQIGVFYQTPSISNQSQPVAGGAVSVNFTGWVQNNGNSGSVVAEVAKADSAGDCSNPTTIFTSSPASLQYPQTEITGSFTGLYPGGAYCWRLVASVPFGVSNGTYAGNWQYFATIGAYISAGAGDPNKPPAAKPIPVNQCTDDGSGCSTSNCNTGSTCNPGGTIGGLAHTLTVALGGTKAGKVTGTGISCPGTCSRSYPNGTSPTLTLTAAASAGQRFLGWGGGGCSGTGRCTVRMNANHAVTATFGPIPKPVPKCTITAANKTVPLKQTKHGGKVGTLTFKAKCNQPVNLSLTGVLTEKLRHGHTKTFHLGPVRASGHAGVTVRLSLKLPHVALTALKQGHPESLAVLLTAKNANGTGRATATIGKLKRSG